MTVLPLLVYPPVSCRSRHPLLLHGSGNNVSISYRSILLFLTRSCEIHRGSEANFVQKRAREGLYHSHTGIRKRTGCTGRD